MALPEHLVDAVTELTRTVRLDDAEAVLVDWCASADRDELAACEPELLALIEGHFFKKRQRRITQMLAAELAAESPSRGVATPTPVEPQAAPRLAIPEMAVPTIAPDPSEEAGRETSMEVSPSRELLAEVSELNRTAKPRSADDLFRTWLAEADDGDLLVLEPDVRNLLNQFLRKRHNALTAAYDQRLARIRAAEHRRAVAPPSDVKSTKAPQPSAPAPSAEPSPATARTDSYDQDFRNYVTSRLDQRLVDLSAHHIFQWNTNYRDTVAEFFDPLMGFLDDEPAGSPITSPVAVLLSDRFRRHTKEIFEKGWLHAEARTDSAAAQAKAENGIQRFLDLPLEVYSAKLALLQDGVSSRSLRMITSAMVSGILRGVATARLGSAVGDLFPRIHRTWARALPFVTASDLGLLLADLHEGPMHVGIQTSLLPFAQAIDDLLEEDPDHAPLPRMADYAFLQRRITVSLQPPSLGNSGGRLEIQICLSESHVDKETLDSAYSEAATAVLAPFAADLRAYADHKEALRAIAVPTIGLNDGDDPKTRLRAILDSTLSRNDAVSAQRPIDFNYAESFPLTDPKHAAYRHVERSSVRRLLQRFDRRNGVRLWCSVRRSGKTTASASDLGSTSESAVVVAETCDHTGRHSGTNFVYTAIQKALAEGKHIPNDFFRSALSEALADSRDAQRITLVLDEYETLFGNLRSSVNRDAHTRYTVVQPLLDQMVEFADQNLIVFLGQQPDAHYMMMSQNQLSAYVEQDQFPLFTHDPDSYRGEFHELLLRVLTAYVNYDHSFANAVYAETGGHPFLTVNVLVAMFDWLIETKQPRSLLQDGLSGPLFQEFLSERMKKREIMRQKPFEFFRKVARDALSERGRADDPWLFSVYAALRQASLDADPDFAIPQNDFVNLISRLGVSLHDEAEAVLGTAVQANFLTLDGDLVRPRIRTLSRVAATVTAG